MSVLARGSIGREERELTVAGVGIFSVLVPNFVSSLLFSNLKSVSVVGSLTGSTLGLSFGVVGSGMLPGVVVLLVESAGRTSLMSSVIDSMLA